MTAPSDLGSGVMWGEQILIRGTSEAFGSGSLNTITIVNTYGWGLYAANFCAVYEENDYDDWFLPSKEELNLMYENLYLNGFGDFLEFCYWSSSTSSTTSSSACMQDFSSGVQSNSMRSNKNRVRAIRYFTATDVRREAARETTEFFYSVGDIGPAGGYIFYIDVADEFDWTYLEVAGNDQSTSWIWGRLGSRIGGTSLEVGTGAANTENIINSLGAGEYAARICYDLELNGYDDWFLPSREELNLINMNIYSLQVCDFRTNYWSSSEDSSEKSWVQNFSTGFQYDQDKNDYSGVRAIRAFNLTREEEKSIVAAREAAREAVREAARIEGFEYTIGDIGPAGGYIFYIDAADEFDWNYMEVAENDQSINAIWGELVSVQGAIATELGTGMSNTEAIITILGTGEYAARICYDFEVNGYDDWFLPSKDELNLIYENLHLNGFGDFARDNYWSSSEYYNIYRLNGNEVAEGQNFTNGKQVNCYKDGSYRVRAIRVF